MNREKKNNIILIALLFVVILFTAFHEGYFSLISIPFLLTLVTAFALAIWLTRSISTKRLLVLILGIFIIEYIKETIGIRSGMWTYHGINGHYNFGVWAWVMGGLVSFTLATLVIIRLLRKLKLLLPKWVNLIILILLCVLILLTLGEYREGTGILFYSFYIVLILMIFYASRKMDFPVFAGIVISSWFVGNLSEYMGSAASGVWTFTYNPNYPPIFLLFGCWPLEILAQYSLSAWLANESLNKDIFLKKEGKS